MLFASSKIRGGKMTLRHTLQVFRRFLRNTMLDGVLSKEKLTTACLGLIWRDPF